MTTFLLPRTDLSHVHSLPSPALRAARESVPAYVAAAAKVRAFRAYAAAQLDAPDDAPDPTARITGLVRAGRPLPASLTALVVEHQAVSTAGARVREVLTDVATGLVDDLDQVLRSTADTMLRDLDRQVREAVAQARDAAARGGDLEPGPALDAGKADEVAEYRAAVRRYDDVRAAQAALVRTWPDGPGAASIALHLADPVAVFPDYAAWRQDGERVEGEGFARRTVRLTPPWPVPVGGEHFHEWLLASDAEPAVPTRAEFNALSDQLATPARTNPKTRWIPLDAL